MARARSAAGHASIVRRSVSRCVRGGLCARRSVPTFDAAQRVSCTAFRSPRRRSIARCRRPRFALSTTRGRRVRAGLERRRPGRRVASFSRAGDAEAKIERRWPGARRERADGAVASAIASIQRLLDGVPRRSARGAARLARRARARAPRLRGRARDRARGASSPTARSRASSAPTSTRAASARRSAPTRSRSSCLAIA